MWKGLERGLDREGLVEELLANFEVEPDAAAAELDRLLGELRARHLLADG